MGKDVCKSKELEWSTVRNGDFYAKNKTLRVNHGPFITKNFLY